MLENLLTPFKAGLSGHTELRAQRAVSKAVVMLNGNVVNNGSSETQGLSARVYAGGLWGFASSSDCDEKSVKNVLAAADRNAKFLTSRLGEQQPPFGKQAEGFIRSATREGETEQSLLLDFARELDAYIANKYPGVVSRYVGAGGGVGERTIVTSDGADYYEYAPGSTIFAQLSVLADDGSVVDFSDTLDPEQCENRFFEDVIAEPAKIFARLDEIYETLMKKREGVFARAGEFDVILDSKLAGILAHEAIGHTTEADLVLGGSVAGPNLGKEVASPMVTLVDFANNYKGALVPTRIFIDDEGTVAQDVTLIENGVLKGFMHNRETARAFGHEALGNARANNFTDEPLIRMRNTAILPGTDKLEDMIASVDDGYYLSQPTNGQADLTSEFMFGTAIGYEIKGGKLGRAIRDTTISGVAFDLLKTVTMLSDEMTWARGACGKKQQITVGMGGPSVKCRVNLGGR